MAPIVVPKQLNTAKKFLDTILEKLPEGEREAARSLYSQAQDELSGISRELESGIATVNETAAKQDAWYNKHKDVIEGRRTDPNPDRPNPITEAAARDALMKDVDTRIGDTREALASQGLFLSTVIPTIIAQHGVEFGEVLDGEKLVQDAIAAKQDIKTYYSQSVAERRKLKAETKYKEEIAAAETRGREAGLKEAGRGNIPYPTSRQTTTTLSGLRKPAEGQPDTTSLDAAVATAMEVYNKQA